jgi:hypothetical protein
MIKHFFKCGHVLLCLFLVFKLYANEFERGGREEGGEGRERERERGEGEEREEKPSPG